MAQRRKVIYKYLCSTENSSPERKKSSTRSYCKHIIFNGVREAFKKNAESLPQVVKATDSDVVFYFVSLT